jgi:hypothetical protein
MAATGVTVVATAAAAGAKAVAAAERVRTGRGAVAAPVGELTMSRTCCIISRLLNPAGHGY